MIHELVILVPKTCKYVQIKIHIYILQSFCTLASYSSTYLKYFPQLNWWASWTSLIPMLKLPFLAQKFVDRHHGFTYHACIVYKSTYTYWPRHHHPYLEFKRTGFYNWTLRSKHNIFGAMFQDDDPPPRSFLMHHLK